MEYLSRLLQEGAEDADFNQHPHCTKLNITHLAFADDILLLSRADTKSISILMDCLNHFGLATGLQVNTAKSFIFMAGVNQDEKRSLIRSAGITEGQLPIKYLGVPLAAGGMKISHYAPLLQSISDQIANWKPSSLSFAGRLQLINSVLQGIQTYWLAILPSPKGVLSRIARMCRTFLWGSSKAAVPWKEICLPKIEGGLGIRDPWSWNRCLLSKLLWRLSSNKETLWTSWIRYRYLGIHNIWTKQHTSQQSTMFRGILHIRDALLQSELSSQAAKLKIESWPAASFSTAAYNHFRPAAQTIQWGATIWTNDIPPKLSFIWWLAMKKRLLTRDRLHFLDVDKGCTFCTHTEESNMHIFGSCLFVQNVLGQLLHWLQWTQFSTQRCIHLDTLTQALHGQIKAKSWLARKRRITIACFVYHIWMARNNIIFKQKQQCTLDIVYRIKTYVYKVGYSLYPNVSILD